MIRGLTYWLRGNLYVSVTNRVNSLSPVVLRGPSFTMPSESGFCKLSYENDTDFEPTSDMIFDAVDQAFEAGKIAVSSMDSEQVTFAGYGEPLLRAEVICDAATMIKDKRHGVPLRIKTNGLVSSSDASDLALRLRDSGIDKMCISLNSDNPKQHQEIMKPTTDAKFGDVCSFVIACVEAGLEVECTAVERPDVNISGVRALAMSLGATEFNKASFHP
mmetsp:Transcript_15879/g.23913  ORF Transcript_15879/g.23913 Transcript_15879/m.23913 type:complete len:218 (+) Transcript_15879:71-724(+)